MSYKCPVCGKEFGDLRGLNTCVGGHYDEEKKRKIEEANVKKLEEKEHAQKELMFSWKQIIKLRDDYEKAYCEVLKKQEQYDKQYGDVKDYGYDRFLTDLINALSF